MPLPGHVLVCSQPCSALVVPQTSDARGGVGSEFGEDSTPLVGQILTYKQEEDLHPFVLVEERPPDSTAVAGKLDRKEAGSPTGRPDGGKPIAKPGKFSSCVI